MKKSITLYLCLTLVLLVSCNKNNSELTVENATYFKNATVITANENGNITSVKKHLVIQNDSIIYVGEKVPKLKGEHKTIDANGKYIIPGLIDSHVHIGNIAGFKYNHKRKYPELAKAYYKQLPKSFLYFGFTTLIDLNNYAPSIINKINEETIKPDIYTCGQQVKVMNGFMMEMEELPKELRYKTSFLHDRFNKNVTYPDSINLEANTPKSLVNKIVNTEKGICVKTLYEDETTGFKKFWESPTKEIMRELVHEADNENIPVLLHTTSFEGHTFALDSGVDIIAHGMWNWTTNPDELTNTTLRESHKELLKNIATKQIGYQPTFRALFGENDVLTKKLLQGKEIDHVLPPAFIDWIKTEEGQWIERKLLFRLNFIRKVNPEFFKKVRANFESDKEMRTVLTKAVNKRLKVVVKFLYENDANLLFATDGVAMGMYTNPPGYNGYLEINHWKDAGVSLDIIFKALTINNAKAFNLEGEIGTVEKGKKANLLILNSNPLVDVTAYNSIESVIINGNLINRNLLSALKN